MRTATMLLILLAVPTASAQVGQPLLPPAEGLDDLEDLGSGWEALSRDGIYRASKAGLLREGDPIGNRFAFLMLECDDIGGWGPPFAFFEDLRFHGWPDRRPSLAVAFDGQNKETFRVDVKFGTGGHARIPAKMRDRFIVGVRSSAFLDVHLHRPDNYQVWRFDLTGSEAALNEIESRCGIR